MMHRPTVGAWKASLLTELSESLCCMTVPPAVTPNSSLGGRGMAFKNSFLITAEIRIVVRLKASVAKMLSVSGSREGF